ncbi:MAG: N-acetyltransferase [Sphingomonadales bacterium]
MGDAAERERAAALKHAVDIAAVETRALREAFIRLPWTVYADDPNWVPPLLMNERKRLGPAGEARDRRLWVARAGGRTVGRISAQLGGDGLGHFGWLEAIDSVAVFDGLFAAAEGWLLAHGARRASGPFSFTINEESGLLIDGFDTPPMIMMPHGRPYYAAHVERLGYGKEMDLFAYRIDTRTPLPRPVQKILALVTNDSRITLRQMRRERFEDEIRTVLDLFNDAWSGNWGFEPFSETHIAEMARDLKPLLPAPAFHVAEYDGRPVAFALGLPNINEMIRDLDGRLFPLGWAKLLFRIRTGRFGSGRLPLMGVRKEFQGTPLGAALAVAVIEQLRAACLKHQVHDGELSWVLETNKGVRTIIEAFGARAYKTYRLYARDLTPGDAA